MPCPHLPWSGPRGGPTAWIALAFTGAGAVLVGIVPEQLLALYSMNLRASIHGLPGQLLTLVFTRPVPLILVMIGIFYLWVYVRHTSAQATSIERRDSQQEPEVLAPIESGVTAPTSLGGGALQ